ncbi:MAG: glutamate-1-semialdehyde 2,1-aminomutase [Candidatus Eremiobacteraeota bacterium]|nr:glutamate-1-semialdehyde 2,1-aminomutase [Candidatus Eremiobacteraeota bacterium]
MNVADAPRTRIALAGGASSPVRAGAAVGGAPFMQSRGYGPYAFDNDGRRYIDYIMAYGPLLFGHAHPSLVSGLDMVAASGSVFGSTHDNELRLAQRIAAYVPSVQQLRFVSSGTEAVMSAVRVARAFTGRPLLLRFAGNYHGHFDAALFGAGASAHAMLVPESGIPAGTAADVIVARYNDPSSVDALLAGRAHQLAAILVEPVAANMGLVLPQTGFLNALRARADAVGALLIFDEVVTWLRLGLGGAQTMLGVAPDLTTFGKAMGGGFPLAAFGGRADVMESVAPSGCAFTGGTFSGNPFCIALGHRVLDLIENDETLYPRMDERAQRLAAGLRSVLQEVGFDYAVTQLGSMVDFKFRAGSAVTNYDQALESDGERFATYYHAMREGGVLLAPSRNELMFLSSVHGDEEIDETIEAARVALRRVRDRTLG